MTGFVGALTSVLASAAGVLGVVAGVVIPVALLEAARMAGMSRMYDSFRWTIDLSAILFNTVPCSLCGSFCNDIG